MKAVVQRVARASVRVGDERIASIGRGMLVLVGVMRGDGPGEARALAEKIARFRFFPAVDGGEAGEGRMDVSALDRRLEALVVSQFTLAADGRRGRRPSFDAAAPAEEAERLYRVFVETLATLGLSTSTGRFGARMEIDLVNDGPVTFALEEAPERAAGR